VYTYTGQVLPMRKPPARTPPTAPTPPTPPTAPTPPAPPSAPSDRSGLPEKPKPPQPSQPPSPSPSPTPPSAPSPPADAAAEQARACATWHSASFSLYPDWGDGRLKIVDHVGNGEDEQIFWAREA
jgi:hypothetical protein